MTDQELKALLAQLALEADRRSAEADRRSAEADRRSAEADQRLARLEQSLAFTSAEADRRSAEADQRLAKLEHTLAQASAEADQRLAKLEHTLAQASAEADQRLAKLEHTLAQASAAADKRLHALNETVNGMGRSQGEAAEEFFFNSLEKEPILGGIRFDSVHPRMRAKNNGREQEFDLVLVNGNAVAVIEVKYRVRIEDIKQLEKQLKLYPQLKPDHRDFALYGGIAGFSVPANALRLAHDKGLFVLKRKGHAFVSETSAMRPQ